MFKESIEAYKIAVRIKPDDAQAYYSLGYAYSRWGNYHAAVSTTKRAIQIRPAMTAAHKNLGIFYSKLGMYNEAMESLSQAIKLEPGNANAHYNLALLCLGMQDRSSALMEYNILKVLSPAVAAKLSKKL
jgi:tetratricopeptide (TPR) repeat protein